VVQALWSRGELAVRERRGFQRTWDLAERVIPPELRTLAVAREEAVCGLLERALAGHGWATRGTLAATWRLKTKRHGVDAALEALTAAGRIEPCELVSRSRRVAGWARPRDLELAESLRAARPRRDRGRLLSPFDPLLWDRARVAELFGFEQVLEIFTPASKRRWGYYCLPVLAGDRLIGRVDLKVDRGARRLVAVSRHFESDPPPSVDREAMRTAIERHAELLGLSI
jgi:uncharacterized protein YcaQ